MENNTIAKDIKCINCNRFLGKVFHIGIVEFAPCPSCKHVNKIKIMENNLDLALRFKHQSAIIKKDKKVSK